MSCKFTTDSKKNAELQHVPGTKRAWFNHTAVPSLPVRDSALSLI